MVRAEANSKTGRARVRLRSGKLYAATVELGSGFVHITAAQRLSRHLDGYACTPIDDRSVPLRYVEHVAWED
jgi:hypothetical protein